MSDSSVNRAPQMALKNQIQLLDTYRQVLTTTFFATLSIIVLLTLTLEVIFKSHSILPYTILAGALGAFFSALTRLYDFEDLPKALTEPSLKLRSAYIVMYAMVPSIVGAIAATVIYVAFASGLIEGALVPKFVCQQKDCTGFDQFINNFGPSSPQDYAKALIWGFAAGFSERLVPDLLRRWVETSSAKHPN